MSSGGTAKTTNVASSKAACSRLKLWSAQGFVEVDGMPGMAGGTISTQICCLLIQLGVNKVLLLSEVC